jgi:hypothetical protein
MKHIILLLLLAGITFGQTNKQALDKKCIVVSQTANKLAMTLNAGLTAIEKTSNADLLTQVLTYTKGQRDLLVTARASVCSASTIKVANATWDAAMAKFYSANDAEIAYIDKHLADLYRERAAAETK